jgi:uncharacterized OsmC-like protein
MTDEDLVSSSVHTTTTRVHGRTLNSAREHHFVIDGSSRPGEEVFSMEAFLAGISSCAVHLFQDFAEEDGIPLQQADVTIQAFRKKDELYKFDHIDLTVAMVGPTRAQAEHLVDRFKGR